MKLVSALVVAIVLAAALSAQVAPGQQRPVFRTGINFVRVDVYASVNGRPVTDLTKDDFEVQEDGVVQRVETFDRISLRAPGAEVERAEPSSVQAGNDAAADARNRVFVLFLDTYHSSVDSTTIAIAAGSNVGDRNARPVNQPDSRFARPLVKFLQQTIGPDDLIALMRPETSVDALTFTRRPSSFEDWLLSGGNWQRRFEDTDLDATEHEYLRCYPPDVEPGVAAAMMARRRERLVLDALHNLVFRLQNLREGRKAILVVSEGWKLYKPDRNLEIHSDGSVPGRPPIGVVNGQPTIGDPRPGYGERPSCDRDRMQLAEMDDESDFRRMLDDANRANASFYPIDPRGLAVFDGLPGTVLADSVDLHDRLESLQTLAVATDGVASVNSNDFTKSFRRISDDLSSYYLLGYNSTNAKPDGKFHRIAVRVKRPGVEVRARRGYNSPTAAEAASLDKAMAPVGAETRSREVALASLAQLADVRPDRPLRLTAAYRWEGTRPVLWVTGELDPAAARLPAWANGGDGALTITASSGQVVATEKVSLTPAARTFVLNLTDVQAAPGDYLMKVRVIGKPGPDADANEQLRLIVPEASPEVTLGQPLFYRRGPYSGVGFQPTADLRFHRAERLRVDVPVQSTAAAVTARLLDRNGKELPVPPTTGQREDNGVRFATAELTLTPLAPADYFLEISVQRGDKTEKTLTAFRIVP